MKKIMFNDKYGLTQAVLDGRKTMTRRIVSFKDIKPVKAITSPLKCSNLGIKALRPKYKFGEVLAIAQSYNKIGLSPSMYCEVPNEYGGTRDGSFDELAGWENKMFVKADLMPHHIKITNIRVEHLQEISDEDCMREGVYEKKLEYTPSGYNPNRTYYTFDGVDYCFNDAREAFAALIDKVSGRGTWDSNPFVFVYEFELID